MSKSGISRRHLLIGGGVGAGLVVAWAFWPRVYAPNLRPGRGEQAFNAFVKIAKDGRVTVAVPQTELGQGVYSSLPQILADELGADWSSVGVEPAPLSPLYANLLLADDLAGEALPSWLGGAGRWAMHEYAARHILMLTGGSTSVRAFEVRLREAGAAARALLSKAAAKRWGVDWEPLDTAGGFVTNGANRLSFGELAEEAAHLSLPEHLPVRGGGSNRLTGQPLPRLDVPPKVDGTAEFAADVRLPDMVFASVRAGPRPGSRLRSADKAGAEGVPGILAIFREPDWVGAVATNWWAANRAVEAMRPVFTGGSAASSVRIDASLAGALAGGGSNIFRSGDAAAPLAAPDAVHSDYQVGLAPSAPLEPLTATARFTGDRLEIWAPTQAPGLARAAAARAADISESAVTIYQTLAGGGYGRKLETKAIEQAALIAKAMRRPVQLSWPRVEETVQDGFRPPAQGRLSARLAAPGGAILAWRAVIAAPDAVGDAIARLRGKAPGAPRAAGSAVEGAVPPYAIPAVAVAHAPVALPIRTGIWRSGAHSYTAFFTECFVDELARRARLEPLSFRMQMLGDNPRLARCLTSAAMLGGWDGGGPGSAMGIAAHSAFGSHVATLVEIAMGGDQRVRVLRAVSAVDCGRIVNPNIVRQQIEGGIVHGISSATGAPILFERGVPNVARLADLRLPTLADCPEISVELIESQEAPGGVTELGVPTVAPAIANALFAMTGQRLRSLPLGSGR